MMACQKVLTDGKLRRDTCQKPPTQTFDAKVIRQKGNSPDYWLRSASYSKCSKDT